MKSKKDSFAAYYNRYANLYNKNDGLSGYSELLTFKSELNQRTEVIKKQVDKIVTNLKANLNSISSSAEICNDKQRTKVLESFFERVLNNYSENLSTLATAVPNKNLEILCRAINEFYEIHNKINAGESVVLAKDMFKAKESYQHEYSHLMAIRSVTDKIFREDSPEKIEPYERLSPSEKKDINDHFLQNIKPDKDEVYLLYGEYKRDENIDDPFYRLIDNLEALNLSPQEHYFKTDTPQNFDKAYRDWFKKMRKENPEFLKKRSQLPKVRK